MANVVGQGDQRVFFPGQRLHFVMNFRHEVMKVDAAFAAIGHACVKHIHQKSLAAPHPTPEIRPLGYFRAELTASQKLVAPGFEIHQLMPERIQFINRSGLGCVMHKARHFVVVSTRPWGSCCRQRQGEDVLGHGLF